MANWFDQEYFDKMCAWIRTADNKVYDQSRRTDKKKFLQHLYWYKKNNNDYREVWIEPTTETEKMYGAPEVLEFELLDIYFPGIMKVGVLPEEVRLQRMDRIEKQLNGPRIDHGPRPTPAIPESIEPAQGYVPVKQKRKLTSKAPTLDGKLFE
jgi:hypothetical protein